MATNRENLKGYFNAGDRPTENQFAELIDNVVNKVDDKATDTDAQNETIDDKYLTPKAGKQNVLAFAPVKKINNISPDNNGNVSLNNITGTASTITGQISKNQVTDLLTDLNAKQNTLVSGSSIKTVNGESILGSGDLSLFGSVKLIGVLSSNFTLANTNVSQNAFPTSCDQFNLTTNKSYFFKGKFLITNGSTSHTKAMGWVIASGLNISSMEYVVKLFSSTLNGISTASSNVQVSGTSSKILNTANSAVTTTIEFEGVLRCTSGGVLTPQITFSTAPGGTNIMKMGSFIEFTEVGSNTIQTIGNVN